MDQSDLLVGIFWTRIGSPTGVAESGTIEEIERVGKAEKPVMLYFSRVAIDPDRIDFAQNQKLKQLKERTYPRGLVESYKSIIEFRDKFAKQLELRVRDLQISDASGELPLSLQFVSADTGELVGNCISYKLDLPKVVDFEIVPIDKREVVEKAVAERVKPVLHRHIALAITNASPSGVRNVYIELELRSDSKKVDIAPLSGRTGAVTESVLSKLARFSVDTLQTFDGGWRLSIEWEAIQPQRTRLINQVLSVYARKSAKLSISARVFADSLPEPFTLTASVNIQVKENEIELKDLMPDWERFSSGIVIGPGAAGDIVIGRDTTYLYWPTPEHIAALMRLLEELAENQRKEIQDLRHRLGTSEAILDEGGDAGRTSPKG